MQADVTIIRASLRRGLALTGYRSSGVTDTSCVRSASHSGPYTSLIQTQVGFFGFAGLISAFALPVSKGFFSL